MAYQFALCGTHNHHHQSGAQTRPSCHHPGDHISGATWTSHPRPLLGPDETTMGRRIHEYQIGIIQSAGSINIRPVSRGHGGAGKGNMKTERGEDRGREQASLRAAADRSECRAIWAKNLVLGAAHTYDVDRWTMPTVI